jgi:hypothetical protein
MNAAGALPGFGGVAVHDACAPYDTYPDTDRASKLMKAHNALAGPAVHHRLARTGGQLRIRVRHPHDQTTAESIQLHMHPHRSHAALRDTKLPQHSSQHRVHFIDALVKLTEGRPWMPTAAGSSQLSPGT